MNRDWFALSQPETRGRVAFALEWYPHVVVDLHEMGGDSTYYFAPPADPANPYITPKQFEWLTALGRENARRFDERGFAYFVREVFDSFYPGYGESWPIFQGAIGMTFEQASPRGLVFRRDDDTLLTYREGIVQHFTAAITSAETAARNRERILRDFLEYRRSAGAGGRARHRARVPDPPGRRPRARRAPRPPAGDAGDRGAAGRRADQARRRARCPPGTLIVPVAQPSSRLLRNLSTPRSRWTRRS